jgi:DNA end-binding protein Ku
MAASRPVWKGQLRLSLVSINVEMFPATKPSAKPSFRQIHEPSGKPIHHEKVVDGIGPIDTDDIRKGFEYEKGDYVLLTDEEIDAVKLETRKTLDLIQFVDEGDIPALYYDAPYFLSPADDLAEDAFRVVRDALRKSRKVGLGQLALRGKEYLVSIQKSDAFFSEIPAASADPELLEVATALIDKKTVKFDPKLFKDHYQAALRELIAQKLKSKGGKVAVDEPDRKRGETGNVIDLMAALKKSLEGGSGTKPAAKAPARKAPAKAAAKKPAGKVAPRKKAS